MTFQQPYAEPLCYTNAELRQMSTACGEGVVTEDALEVTTGGAGLDLFVAAGEAYIAGTQDAPDQGMYWVRNGAQVTVTADAADGTDPRIDQVIVTVRDGDYSGLNYDVVVDVLAGTPTTGATLTNLDGAATLPDNTLRLAYVLVPATFTGPFVDATHIKDARLPFESCSGQYRDYVPEWGASLTLDAASVFRWCRNGDQITVEVEATFDSGGSGDWTMSLPVPPRSPATNKYIGSGYYLNTGGTVTSFYATLVPGDDLVRFYENGTATTFAGAAVADEKLNCTLSFEAE